MLSHIRGDNGVPARDLIDGLNDIRAGQTGIIVFQRIFFLQFPDGLHPLPMLLLFQPFVQILQHGLQIAYQTCVHPDVFVDFRRINVNMNDLGIFGKLFGISGDPV